MSTQCKSNLEYLKNYRKIVKKVGNIVKCFDPEARIYVFGSVVRGNYTVAGAH